MFYFFFFFIIGVSDAAYVLKIFVNKTLQILPGTMFC